MLERKVQEDLKVFFKIVVLYGFILSNFDNKMCCLVFAVGEKLELFSWMCASKERPSCMLGRIICSLLDNVCLVSILLTLMIYSASS